jgi:hypothetical protein
VLGTPKGADSRAARLTDKQVSRSGAGMATNQRPRTTLRSARSGAIVGEEPAATARDFDEALLVGGIEQLGS